MTLTVWSTDGVRINPLGDMTDELDGDEKHDFDLNTVCFSMTFGFTAMSFPVTSSLLPPHAKDLGTLWGVAASVRGSIQHPVFFESMVTHARGLGRSLRVTHAHTNSMHVCAFL